MMKLMVVMWSLAIVVAVAAIVIVLSRCTRVYVDPPECTRCGASVGTQASDDDAGVP